MRVPTVNTRTIMYFKCFMSLINTVPYALVNGAACGLPDPPPSNGKLYFKTQPHKLVSLYTMAIL